MKKPCCSCIDTLAHKLIEHHKIDLIRAYELAEKGVLRVENRETPQIFSGKGNPSDYSKSCINPTGTCKCFGTRLNYLTKDAGAYDTKITVDDASIWSSGDYFHIYGGGNDEYHQIWSIAGNVISMTDWLLNNFPDTHVSYIKDDIVCTSAGACYRTKACTSCSCPDPLPNSHYVSNTCGIAASGCVCLPYNANSRCYGSCSCVCSGSCLFDCDDDYVWNGVECVLAPAVKAGLHPAKVLAILLEN